MSALANPTSTDASANNGTTTYRRSRSFLAGRSLTGALTAFLLVGALLSVGVVLHLVSRTALIGAVFLSAYLGGAVAAHVRAGNTASIAFTVVFAVLLWCGYALREPRVRDLARG